MSKIIIIGGGLSGLVTAYELSKNNHEIELLEKEDRLGGLAGSFKINDFFIEKFYHHIFKNDSSALELIKELDLEKELLWNDGSTSIYYNGKMHAFNTPLDLLSFKPLNIFNRLRLGLAMLFLQKSKNWHNLTTIPAHQWLKKYCGKKTYEIVWQPLLKGKFHDFHEKVSMAWFWARIHTRGNSKEKGKSKEKLGYLKGSLQVLINSLEAACKERGVKIHLNAKLEKIISSEKKIILASGETYQFEKLICAIPSSQLYQCLAENQNIPLEYLNKIKSIKYLGFICAFFTSPQSLSKYYWHNVNDPASPFLAFIQHTNLINKSEYGNQNLYYLGTYIPEDNLLFSKTENEITEIFFSYLKKICPEFEKKSVGFKTVFKQKNAQHIVDCSYPEKIPEYEIKGTDIYLLNFSQIFPEDRGINFAIKEAKKFANLIK